MGRRSLKLFGILLLCIFAGSCSKRSLETSDELVVQDYDINIYEEETLNEENSLGVNRLEPDDNIMEINETEETIVTIIEEEETFAMQADSFSAGSVINTVDFSQEILDSLFYIEELNQEIIDRITGKSYKEGADIPYDDLRYIRLLHMGFDGLTHVGEMIVNKAIADDLINIFKELYKKEYPIEKMLLIDDYDADDLKSMADNNSSSFNYRFVEGTTRRSVHSDGLAIDINPLYNPYVRSRDGKLEILPESGAEYADRDKENDYYIRKDDPCYKAFVSRGFTWGGEWKNSKDYQHFEKKLSY